MGKGKLILLFVCCSFVAQQAIVAKGPKKRECVRFAARENVSFRCVAGGRVQASTVIPGEFTARIDSQELFCPSSSVDVQSLKSGRDARPDRDVRREMQDDGTVVGCRAPPVYALLKIATQIQDDRFARKDGPQVVR